jgi:hypothetical protein
MLLHVLQDIWQQVPNLKPLRVGVALTGLTAHDEHQPDLITKPKDAKLVRAIDAVNESSAKARWYMAMPGLIRRARSLRVPEVKEL